MAVVDIEFVLHPPVCCIKVDITIVVGVERHHPAGFTVDHLDTARRTLLDKVPGSVIDIELIRLPGIAVEEIEIPIVVHIDEYHTVAAAFVPTPRSWVSSRKVPSGY